MPQHRTRISLYCDVRPDSRPHSRRGGGAHRYGTYLRPTMSGRRPTRRECRGSFFGCRGRGHVCQCWMECSFTCSFSHALSRTCNTQLLLSLYLAISVSLCLSVSLFFSHLTVCSPACSVVKLPTAHPWNSRISIEPSACARKRG